MLASLRRHYGEVQLEASWLIRSRYPQFVTAHEPALAADDVPVFVFHSFEPAEFEAQLRYLVDNGYQTLSCDTFLAHLQGEKVRPKSVLLTIDDGRASVWSVGWPLLRKYGLRAVVFLIPGYMSEGEEAGPTLEDVWSGRLAAERLPRLDPALMTWREVRKAVESGVLEVGSHTLYHHPVPTSDRIVGYLSPGEGRALFDLPIEPGWEHDIAWGERGRLYGLPIYDSAPLMSGLPCYRPDPDLAHRCIAQVTAAGGAQFFRSRQWRKDLDQLVAEHRRRNGEHGRVLDPSEQRAAMVDDLRRSRKLLEERLERPVRHFCFPYTAGSDQAVDAAKEAGYLTSFWGVLADRRTNRPGEDPYYCPRLKADYIFRLPGRGRRALSAILSDKLKRRLSGRPVY